MTVRQRTGLWVLLAAVALALAFSWYFRERPATSTRYVPWGRSKVVRDLDLIRADTLRVLVLQDPLVWEERPGAVSGFEFEVLERFARHIGIPIEAVVVDHRDSMYSALQQGLGDVIAAQYAPAPWERHWFGTTKPVMVVRPMVAQVRAEANTVRDAMDGTVHISAWSPFRDGPGVRPVLNGLKEETATPDALLMDVVIGRVRACVVTDATAAHEGTRLSALEFIPLKGKERSIVFAVRNDSPRLKQALDAWLSDPVEERFRTALLDGYLDRGSKPGALRRRSMPIASDSISPYDQEFRKNGQGFGWKWQLLAAMAWKESRFDSTAVSTKGAQGIMQFMPNTAARYGLDTAMAVGDHIRAAKRYITRLDTLWMRAVPDREQRLRFVLASYNAGVGHIIDAQRLAERSGLDPKRWENHVERAVLLLAKPQYYTRPEMKNGYCKGSQVFHYVRDIVSLYEQLTGMARSGAQASSRPKGTGEDEVATPVHPQPADELP